MDRDKLVEKIRKLFSLSGSSNAHEAMLALEKARMLLAEHQISESEVLEKNSSAPIGPDVSAVWVDIKLTGVPLWVNAILKGVERLYDVRFIYYGSRAQVRVFGEEASAITASITTEYLYKFARDLSSRFMVRFTGIGLPREEFNAKKYGFLEGFGYGVVAQVNQTLTQPVIKESRALAVLSINAIDTFIRSKTELGKSKIPASHAGDENSFAYGYKKGTEVSLASQIQSSEKKLMENRSDVRAIKGTS